ncbi:uncharacterized protein LOC115739210 [Rhodamnia argentea]|uniref:Uncharacterized protein LOC115739210 n=1 Tax=Rhodamnia argentea TaxID=178133 RepID=A0A8B8NZX9_9MYRT|nr:uncharacterized protein LOC115739210 [Rhodamnia argentea]
MLLRSSSTPVLGSLRSSFSDGGPSHHGHHEAAAVQKAAALHNHHNFSFNPKGSLNFSTISCNSSPISPSIHDLGGDAPSHHRGGGFRRVQSEGNLEGLAQAYNMSPLSKNEDRSHTASHAKKSSARPRSMMLETIPSFSFDRYGHAREGEDEENSDFDFDEREEHEEYDEAPLVESSVMLRGSKSMSLIAEEEASSVGSVNMIEKSGFEENKERVRQEMNLAIGLGGGGGNWGGDGGSRGGWGSNSADEGADGENNQGVEEYYKKMVEESPNNSLFLRNYAQFLYQTQGDQERAEEYYARAILADPQDGEILSQYAKLVWELHRDQPRASTYFERAVQASPEDSHVQAAYASFLWEVDDDEDQGEDEDEYESSLATYAMSPQFRGRSTASVSA